MWVKEAGFSDSFSESIRLEVKIVFCEIGGSSELVDEDVVREGRRESVNVSAGSGMI